MTCAKMCEISHFPKKIHAEKLKTQNSYAIVYAIQRTSRPPYKDMMIIEKGEKTMEFVVVF